MKPTSFRRPSWYVPRRALLRGAGAALALPFLEQMLPPGRAAQAAEVPKRFVAFFVPNGIYMQRFTPAAEGAGYALTPILTPLAPIKDDVLVASGFSNRVAGEAANLHLAGIAALLTGALPSADGDVHTGVSADRLMAASVSGKTPFASLELGGGEEGVEACDGMPCVYGRTLSWANATTPVLKETDPVAAFQRVFGGATKPASPSQPDAPDPAVLRRKRILDAVKGDADRLRRRLGKTDAAKLDQYLTSVNELDARVAQLAMSGGSPSSSPSCGSATAPTSSFAADYPARAKALMDVIALSLQCDRTRVATFMLADWESAYVFRSLGLSGQHHVDYSHHENKADKVDALEKIDRWEVEQFAYLAAKLKAMPELDGSVLDHSALLFGSEMSDGDTHSYSNLPILLAGRLGGAVKPGRHKRFAGDPPLANLLLTLMRGFGLSDAKFGNSTGTADLLA